ncbi:MAG: response regulator [Candidatus Binatia bacterium]
MLLRARTAGTPGREVSASPHTQGTGRPIVCGTHRWSDTEVPTSTQHSLLIVAEDPQNRHALAQIVAISRFAVATASSSDEALNRLRAGLQPCALLLDLSDPWTAFAGFQAEGGNIATIPVLVVLANPSDEAHAHALGMREVLHKPVDYGLLVAAIARHCSVTHPAP